MYLDSARFWIGSKKIWDAQIYLVKTLSYTFYWCSCICLIKLSCMNFELHEFSQSSKNVLLKALLYTMIDTVGFFYREAANFMLILIEVHKNILWIAPNDSTDGGKWMISFKSSWRWSTPFVTLIRVVGNEIFTSISSNVETKYWHDKGCGVFKFWFKRKNSLISTFNYFWS